MIIFDSMYYASPTEPSQGTSCKSPKAFHAMCARSCLSSGLQEQPWVTSLESGRRLPYDEKEN